MIEYYGFPVIKCSGEGQGGVRTKTIRGGAEMATQDLQQILRSLDKLNENLLRIARALETLTTR